jgi:hypothetical protein
MAARLYGTGFDQRPGRTGNRLERPRAHGEPGCEARVTTRHGILIRKRRTTKIVRSSRRIPSPGSFRPARQAWIRGFLMMRGNQSPRAAFFHDRFFCVGMMSRCGSRLVNICHLMANLL